jgi:signal transduction histidine kinase/CheY-like chemotaxis protein
MESEPGEPGTNARRRGAVILVIATIIGGVAIAALIYGNIISSARRDAAIIRQQHSYEVMILARDLDATMGNAEATLGRFVISGDKRIGQMFADSWRRAGTLLDKLASETGDNPAQRALTTALRTAYNARGDELGAIALRTNYGQNPQALSKYYEAGTSPTLAHITTGLDRIINVERAKLDTRTEAADMSIEKSNRAGVILSIGGLVLALGATGLGFATWIASVRRRREEARNEDLELAVQERTAELRESNERLIGEMHERGHAEQKLRQVQKMDAIGQLTGGIAHDFNNMLGVVIGGIELARRRIDQGAGGTESYLDQAMEGANRAAALTKRLLTFARAEPLLPAATDADQLIAAMAELLDRTLGDHITVTREPGASWPIFVDTHQLENALLNLAVNARDAMPDGGTLTIATSDQTLDGDRAVHAPAGDFVCIAVSDTGTGMAADVIERVFEPFFTTKPHGRGTGLGLSQALGFARASGGDLALTSDVGHGTRASLYLPRHAATMPVPARPVARLGDGTPRRDGRVALVIEDDPRVLNTTVAALRELGHDPIACGTPAQVPALLRARRDIGLIVSDVQMPGVTGPQLVDAIRFVHPAMPVLFVTGFAGEVEHAAAFGGHHVLRKPFTLAGLSAALDTVLGPEADATTQAKASEPAEAA